MSHSISKNIFEKAGFFMHKSWRVHTLILFLIPSLSIYAHQEEIDHRITPVSYVVDVDDSSSSDEESSSEEERRAAFIEQRNTRIRRELNIRAEFNQSLDQLQENLHEQKNVSEDLHTELRKLSDLLNDSVLKREHLEFFNNALGQYNTIWDRFSKYLKLQQTYFDRSFSVERDIRNFEPHLIDFEHVIRKLENNKTQALALINKLGSSRSNFPEEYVHSLTVKSIQDRIFEEPSLQNIKIKLQKLVISSSYLPRKERQYLHTLIKYVIQDMELAQEDKNSLDQELWNLETYEAPTVFSHNIITSIIRCVENHERSLQEDDTIAFHMQNIQQKIVEILDYAIENPLQVAPPRRIIPFPRETRRPISLLQYIRNTARQHN